MNLKTKLRSLGACDEAREWASAFSDPQQAWDACERGDWMLWILGRMNKSEPWSDGRKPLVACAMDCALTAKKHWPAARKEQISKAVAVIEAWTIGKATTDEAKAVRSELAAPYVDAYVEGPSK